MSFEFFSKLVTKDLPNNFLDFLSNTDTISVVDKSDNVKKMYYIFLKKNELHIWGKDAILEINGFEVYLVIYQGTEQDRLDLVNAIEKVFFKVGLNIKFQEE